MKYAPVNKSGECLYLLGNVREYAGVGFSDSVSTVILSNVNNAIKTEINSWQFPLDFLNTNFHSNMFLKFRTVCSAIM